MVGKQYKNVPAIRIFKDSFDEAVHLMVIELLKQKIGFTYSNALFVAQNTVSNSDPIEIQNYIESFKK